MKLCHATQLHMLALETVSHRKQRNNEIVSHVTQFLHF